jgi:hypothetical protein
MARAWKSAVKRTVLSTLVRGGSTPLHLTALGKRHLTPGERIEEITLHASKRANLSRGSVEEKLIRKILLKQATLEKYNTAIAALKHELKIESPSVKFMSSEMQKKFYQREEQLHKIEWAEHRAREEQMKAQVMLRKKIGWELFEKVFRTIREID